MPDDPASGSTRTWRWVASDEKSAHTVFFGGTDASPPDGELAILPFSSLNRRLFSNGWLVTRRGWLDCGKPSGQDVAHP